MTSPSRIRRSRTTTATATLAPRLVLSLATLGPCFAVSGCDEARPPATDDGGSSQPDGGISPGNPPGGPGFDFERFDATLRALIAEHELAGATATVVHRDFGVLHQAAYGDFAPDRVFLLASSSKILSAGILMRLHDQGLLDIDATLPAAVGDDWGVARRNVTLAQTLSNSSGMVGLKDNPIYPPYLCQSLDGGDLETCARSIYFAFDLFDVVPPDTRFRYGGGQWQLAGGVAVAVAGKSWAELVRETYVEPCGLRVLGYANPFAEALARGGISLELNYPSYVDGSAANIRTSDNPNIEGGAYTTVGDYAQILLMHLRGGMCPNGRVLSEASVARMQDDRIFDAYGGSTGEGHLAQGYGLGWWVHRDLPGVVSDSGLYGATPWLDVERGYAVVILVEANESTGRAVFEAMQPVTQAIIDAGR